MISPLSSFDLLPDGWWKVGRRFLLLLPTYSRVADGRW